MDTSKVSSKWQVVIPRHLREAEQIRVGSEAALLSLQRVTLEDRAVTERAVSWYEAGMDFGDAMIAASSHGSARVETFDRDFARLARKLGTAPPVEFAVK